MRMLRVTALHLFIIVLFLVLFDVCYCLCSRVVLGVMFVGLSCESITPLSCHKLQQVLWELQWSL